MMKKFSNKLKVLGHSLLYGLKGADEVIKPSTTDNEGQVIETQQTKEDMYQYYKQQEHKYEYYKIWREADKYDVKVNITGFDGVKVNSLNTEGINPKGEYFTKNIDIDKGMVQPLWFYLTVPKDAKELKGQIISSQIPCLR